jgi:hypothetical protein
MSSIVGYPVRSGSDEGNVFDVLKRNYTIYVTLIKISPTDAFLLMASVIGFKFHVTIL